MIYLESLFRYITLTFVDLLINGLIQINGRSTLLKHDCALVEHLQYAEAHPFLPCQVQGTVPHLSMVQSAHASKQY